MPDVNALRAALAPRPARTEATPIAKPVKAPKLRGQKSATWHRSRTWCEDRAKGRCEAGASPDCRGRGCQAHHRHMRSQGGSDDVANLLWVCEPCHTYIHGHPAESYEAGWLIRGVS